MALVPRFAVVCDTPATDTDTLAEHPYSGRLDPPDIGSESFATLTYKLFLRSLIVWIMALFMMFVLQTIGGIAR